MDWCEWVMKMFYDLKGKLWGGAKDCDCDCCKKRE
jgi:hypothetical protein